MSASEVAAPTAEAPEDRHEAISEILRELRGDAEPGPDAAEPGPPAGQPPQPPPAEPADEVLATATAGQNAADEGPETGDGNEKSPVAGESVPSLAPRPAPQPAPPSASRTLILVHASLVVIFALGTWLTYRQVSRTLSAIASDLRDRPAAPAAAGGRPEVGAARPEDMPASASPSSLAPRPSPRHSGAASRRPDGALAYMQEVERGDLFFHKEQYQEAAAAYQRATEIVPLDFNDGAAAFHLGECYLRLKDTPRAIAAFEAVATAYPSLFQPKALYQLGRVHMELGSFAKAREAFYALLLRRARYGPDAAPLVEEATYRVADTYWLEAEALSAARKGAGQ